MIKNTYIGKFIVLEGPEGGGKSTQAKLLARAMEEKGYPVLLTKEPTDDKDPAGGSLFGKLVRFIYQCRSLYEKLPAELDRCIYGRDYGLMREMAHEAGRRHLAHFEDIVGEIKRGNHINLAMLMQLGYIFDRHDHRVRLEIPALGQGKYVVSDRDFLSTLAYGLGEGLDWKRLLSMHYEILGKDFIVPDLILLLDVPLEVGLERTLKKQGGKTEYFDDPERMTKIRNAYLEIVKQPPLSDLRIVMVDGSRDEEIVHREIMDNVELLIKGFS